MLLCPAFYQSNYIDWKRSQALLSREHFNFLNAIDLRIYWLCSTHKYSNFIKLKLTMDVRVCLCVLFLFYFILLSLLFTCHKLTLICSPWCSIYIIHPAHSRHYSGKLAQKWQEHETISNIPFVLELEGADSASVFFCSTSRFFLLLISLVSWLVRLLLLVASISSPSTDELY